MNDVHDTLTAVVREVCAKLSDAEIRDRADDGGWNAPLWAALEELGMTTIAVPEEAGGSGGTISDAVAVLQVLGEHAAAIPFAESCLLGGWLLARCGAPVPRGPLTATVAGDGLHVVRHGDEVEIRGSIPRVPWARQAEHLLVVHDAGIVLLRAGEFEVLPRTNLAGEPRDDVLVDRVLTADHDLGPCLAERSSIRDEFQQRAALSRAALLAGAARRALALAVDYAGEREQFGRPIARFQAVQQYLAAMAGEVLAMRIAVDAAAVAVAEGHGALAVAAAKTTTSGSAGVVASLAHQVHGALGYTAEHPLHRTTTRLWAWRDEGGSEHAWAADLGRRALRAGPGGLWALITATEAGR
ncbi:acyl-CoA dehydrogenase family protein [Nocardioides sp. L-11A]|uniref:acyl-CoA dehydrogenase family protein n=1 Tax=Nocardioides sp. L-11A TaxID=3043848 RepID=UPI00249A7EEB|nr:acyl-CoA dehydrogenase family protein [Nocardioides sp. L-11A]